MRNPSRRPLLAAVFSVLAVVSLPASVTAGSPGPSGTLLFNAQVNMTAPAPPAGMVDNFSKNKQNEPGITRDPLTGVLLAGANDEIDEPLCSGAGTAASPGSCPFDPAVGISGFYRSTDNGMSWTQSTFANQCGVTIHTLPGYCQLGLASEGDPILTVGPARGSNGHFSWSNGSVVYYGNLTQHIGNPFPVIGVSRSTNDGASWMPPVIASTSDNPVDFNDKDFIWADRNPSSPFFGTVYVSWTLFQGNGKFGKSGAFSPEPIVVSHSSDGGATWSKPIRLTASVNNNAVGGRQDSAIRTGPDGTVYVFWDGAIDKQAANLVAVSHDGGVSFSRPMLVTTVNPIPSPLPGSSFRDNSEPAVDVNPLTGALDVAWADWDTSTNTAFIKVTESTDGAMTWSAPVVVGGSAGKANAFFPWLAYSPAGTHLFVAWPAQTWVSPGTAPGAAVVHQFAAYNLRTAGAWSGAHLLSTATGDPDGSSTNSLGAQFLGDYTSAVATNSAAYFVWTDTRNEAPCAAVDAFRAGTGPKPNPDLQCPADSMGRLFGNSDIFVGAVGY